MPKKSKKKTDRKRRKGRMGTDPVTVQINIRAEVPRGFRLSASFMQTLVSNWAKDGDTPPGIEIDVVRWRNPARKGHKGQWRTATTTGEKQCRLIRRMLRGSSTKLDFTQVG